MLARTSSPWDWARLGRGREGGRSILGDIRALVEDLVNLVLDPIGRHRFCYCQSYCGCVGILERWSDQNRWWNNSQAMPPPRMMWSPLDFGGLWTIHPPPCLLSSAATWFFSLPLPPPPLNLVAWIIIASLPLQCSPHTKCCCNRVDSEICTRVKERRG